MWPTCIDDICVIRSMHTDMPNHEPSLLMMNSGDMPADPAQPRLVADLRPGHRESEPARLRRTMSRQAGRRPALVEQQLPARHLPGDPHQQQHARSRKASSSDITNRYLPRPAQRSAARPAAQLNEKHLEQRGKDEALEARIQSLEMAFRMQFEAQEAFDLRPRNAPTRELYGDGAVRRRLPDRPAAGRARRAGRADLLRRRPAVGRSRRHQQPPQPRPQESISPIAALLKDLKSARPARRDAGDLGRRVRPHADDPKGAKGRDHNAYGFTMWLAGGGVKGGMRLRRHRRVRLSQAVENRMHVHDLHATILHLMGIDHERLTYRYGGRDFRLTDVSGRVAREILA